MAQESIKITEEAFDHMIEIMTPLIPQLREHLDAAVRRITALSGEWDDEDYRNFLESFRYLESKLNSIEEETAQLIETTKQKREIIYARRTIKMGG